MKVADVMPASVPPWTSSSSTSKPRRSAQREYMRNSISVQSCASVPPAPEWTSQIASRSSCSPVNSARSSNLSRSAANDTTPASTSGSTESSPSSRPSWNSVSTSERRSSSPSKTPRSSRTRASSVVTLRAWSWSPHRSGRLVATGRLLDVHGLLRDVVGSLGHRSCGRGARAVSHAVAHRLLEWLPGGGGLERLRALHGPVGRGVPDVARLPARAVVGDDLEVRDVPDEVVLHARHHRREHVEALALPLGQRILLAHRAQVDALAQVVHLVEVLAPVLVDHREHHAALDLAERVAPDRLLLLLVELHRVVGQHLHDRLTIRQVELVERDPRRERALDLGVQLLEVPLLL